MTKYGKEVVRSEYLNLRDACGRIVSQTRIEVCVETSKRLECLRRRNGSTFSVMLEGCSISTYNKKTFEALKQYEVCYLYSTKLNRS